MIKDPTFNSKTAEDNVTNSNEVVSEVGSEGGQVPEDERRLSQFLGEHPEHAELIQELRANGLVGVVDEGKFAESLEEIRRLRAETEQKESTRDEVKLNSYLEEHPEHAELIAEMRQKGMIGIVDEERAQETFKEITALRKKAEDLQREIDMARLKKEISRT